MRQAGHLAAAGLIALQELVDRLKEDHENAKLLARGIACLDGIAVDETRVKTNIIFFNLTGMEDKTFIEQLEKKQIKLLMTGEGIFRAVLHREVSKEQVQTVIETIRLILAKL